MLAAVFVVVSTVAARGQGPDPAANAAIHLGPLAMTPDLSIPGLGYESNVFNESENPRKDFTANVQPAADAWLTLGRLRLQARQQFNLLYFKEHASERAVNTSSTVKAELELLWGRPYVTGAFIKTNERADARIDTRAVNRSRPASAGIDLRLSSSTNLDLGVNDNRVSFDEDATFDGTRLQAALDRNTRSYHAALRYGYTPSTALTLTVARQEERFRFSPQQDSHTLRVMPGLSLSTDAVLTGRIEVGWMEFQPQDPAQRRFTGVLSNVDVGYVFLGLTRLQLSVNRDVMPSIGRVSTYELQTGVTGTVTHRISERWDITGSAKHTRLDFGKVRGLSAPGSALDHADTVNTFGGGIGFFFTRGLRIGLRAESTARKSVVAADRYDNLRILTSISYVLN